MVLLHQPREDERRGLFQTREFTLGVCPRTCLLLESGFSEPAKHSHNGRKCLC